MSSSSTVVASTTEESHAQLPGRSGKLLCYYQPGWTRITIFEAVPVGVLSLC
jgi:hypothetical protein